MDLKCPEGYTMNQKTWMCERVTCDKGWKLENNQCVRIECPKGYTLAGDDSCKSRCRKPESEIFVDGKCWDVKSGCALRDTCRVSNLELLQVSVDNIESERDRLRKKFIRRDLQKVEEKPVGFDQK